MTRGQTTYLTVEMPVALVRQLEAEARRRRAGKGYGAEAMVRQACREFLEQAEAERRQPAVTAQPCNGVHRSGGGRRLYLDPSDDLSQPR